MSDSDIQEQENDETDDLFTAEHQFAESRRLIRKSGKRVYDRLRSIQRDVTFVCRVLDHFSTYAATCNERCGRWYVPTQRIAGSAYFKSTDGHTDHCQFSLRRLNVHLLPLISSNGGLVLVDSTRRGKRMPDALSKTVPIWCCVLNRTANKLLSRNWTEEQLDLMTPTNVVSVNERNTIVRQIDGWVESLIDSGLDPTLLKVLDKPLRPLWITPDSKLTPRRGTDAQGDADLSFFALVLVTASRCVPDGIERLDGYTYIQGAADDEEMWARGLTPALFGLNQDDITASSVDCEKTIDRLVLHDKQTGPSSASSMPSPVRIGKTTVYACDAVLLPMLERAVIIDLSPSPQLIVTSTTLHRRHYLHVPTSHGKKGCAQLSRTLTQVDSFLGRVDMTQPILVTDDQQCKSKASVTILMILARYFTQEGVLSSHPCLLVTKDILRNRLLTVVNSRPGLNPDRAFLKSLNAYLMSGPYRPPSFDDDRLAQ